MISAWKLQLAVGPVQILLFFIGRGHLGHCPQVWPTPGTMVTTFETLPQSQARNHGDGPITASTYEGQGRELGVVPGGSTHVPLYAKEVLHESLPCLCVWTGEYGVSGECLMGKTCGSPYSQVESDCH